MRCSRLLVLAVASRAWLPKPFKLPSVTRRSAPPVVEDAPRVRRRVGDFFGGKNNILAFPPGLRRKDREEKIGADALSKLLLADPGDVDVELRLTRGAVPAELSGTLYVNGPARLRVGGREAASPSHPLDGHGYVRAFSIQQDATRHATSPHVRQRARLKGRFVRTWAFETEMFWGFNLFRGFFSLPLQPLRELGFLFNALAMWRKNVANTCVVEWPAGQLLALWEMGPPHALESGTLNTSPSWGHLKYLKTADCALSRLQPFLAHTKRWADGEASTLVGLSPVGSTYTFYEFDVRGACASSVAAKMPFDRSLVHDFAITRDYYVVLEAPFLYEPSLGSLVGADPMLGGGSVVSDVGQTTRLVLVPRPGGTATETLVFDTGSHAMAFHLANAWQDDADGSLVVVSCAFDEYKMGSEYGFDPATGSFDPSLLLSHDHEAGPFLYETRVDVAGGLRRLAPPHARVEAGEALQGFVTRDLADGARVHRDFPKTHPAREGRPTRFVFCTASPDLWDGDPFFPFHTIQKVDLADEGRTLTWTPPGGAGCYVGEPAFAPRPNASGEDDGWLLVVVHDVPNENSELVILDAKTLTLLAELRFDELLPLGLHGSWSPAPE